MNSVDVEESTKSDIYQRLLPPTSFGAITPINQGSRKVIKCGLVAFSIGHFNESIK